MKRVLHRDGEQKEQSSKIAAASEMLKDAKVTATVYKVDLADVSANAFGSAEVQISDATTEFTATYSFGIEQMDVTTGGLVTLKGIYPAFPAFYRSEYTLSSKAFKGFDDVHLVKSTLPDDCKLTFTGAGELEQDGKFKIYISDFTVKPLSVNKIAFELQFQLKPAVSEPAC
jgi:hypothetical protein